MTVFPTTVLVDTQGRPQRVRSIRLKSLCGTSLCPSPSTSLDISERPATVFQVWNMLLMIF